MKPSQDTKLSSAHAAWPWLILAFVLLGIAINYSTFRIARDTYRYLFVLDITESMNVRDMQIGSEEMTRLEFAKNAVAASLRDLPCGSEVGLAIFSGHRTFVFFIPVEICEHYRTLFEMLETVNWRMAWAARSEVAKGLYSGIDAALDIGHGTKLIFLTDGHEAPPIHPEIRTPFSADPGSVLGMIGGIGGPVPSRIPHIDDDGNIVGYWRHDEVMQIDIYSLGRAGTEQREAFAGINMGDIARRIALGQEHLSSLREVYLQQLAAQTGLAYDRVDSTSEFVESLRNEKYARHTTILSDMGWIPATLAFSCLVYCLVVVPWRSRPVSTNKR